jgi:hypothetical protein
VRVTKYGELRHPMPVGVHTPSGWIITRARADLDDQWVDVKSDVKPDSIALDPYHVTWDWDWRDNTEEAWVGTIHAPDVVVDWPFLRQENRARTVIAAAPRVWYSGPQGLLAGIGLRSNYMGLTDLHTAMVGTGARLPAESGQISRLQFRAKADDVYLAPFMKRPLMGAGFDAMFVDGIARGELFRRWDLSPFVYANGPVIHLEAKASGTYPTERVLLPEQWDNAHVTELSADLKLAEPALVNGSTVSLALQVAGGYAAARDASARSGGYGRVFASLESITWLTRDTRTLTLRLNGGYAPKAPMQRAIFASSKDPFETFTNNYFRPRQALFKQPDFTLVPTGGAGLRGFTPFLALESTVSANAEASQRLGEVKGSFGGLSFWFSPFADVGVGQPNVNSPARLSSNAMVDIGAGFALRGQFYDREVNLRIDIPVAANDPVTPEALSGLGKSIRWGFSWR